MHLRPKHLARAAVAAAWQARVNYQLALLASQQAGGQPLATGGLRGSRSLDPGLCAPPASQWPGFSAKLAPWTPWLCRARSNVHPDHTTMMRWAPSMFSCNVRREAWTCVCTTAAVRRVTGGHSWS